MDCHSNKYVVVLHVVVQYLLYRLLIDDDVYRTDREVDKYKSSSSQSLKQLVDILTTYVMYNVDLGKTGCMNESHLTYCISYVCTHRMFVNMFNFIIIGTCV